MKFEYRIQGWFNTVQCLCITHVTETHICISALWYLRIVLFYMSYNMSQPLKKDHRIREINVRIKT